MNNLTCILRLGVAIGVLMSSAVAMAVEVWPSKPVKIVVTYAAGTPNDIWGRRIADRLSKATGQSVIVENRVGAGGTIGTAAVAQAPADGYTLLFAGVGELTIAPNLYQKLPYSVDKNLTPITRFIVSRPILVVHPGLGIKSATELVAMAKTKPGFFSGGSAGNGTITHLLLAQLNHAAGIDITHVPYKSGSQAITDVIAGHTSLMFDWMTTSAQLISSRQLTPLLVVGSKRKPALPDVPTASEAGLPTIDIWGWNAFLAPGGTPRGTVDEIYRALQPILNSSEFAEMVAEIGADVITTTPDELGAFLRSETKKMAALIRANDMKVD
ncbi:MAG: Bug family tripartite tricarboxylate transporter substrate binding protein [Burkholderiales bacterium]